MKFSGQWASASFQIMTIRACGRQYCSSPMPDFVFMEELGKLGLGWVDTIFHLVSFYWNQLNSDVTFPGLKCCSPAWPQSGTVSICVTLEEKTNIFWLHVPGDLIFNRKGRFKQKVSCKESSFLLYCCML